MAPKYAKDQPGDFVNRIEKVAIVGVSHQPTLSTYTYLVNMISRS